MGVDTKAILRKGTGIEEIVSHLSKKYSDVKVESTHTDYYFVITFKDNKDNRSLNVFTKSEMSAQDYDIEGTLLSLGLWGNSVEIMKYLLNEFGGYLDENDCDSEGFYSVAIEKYESYVEPTPMSAFRSKVIAKLGYNKLDTVMALFHEYCQLKAQAN